MNLLLIDYDIPGLDIFIKSCNSSTKCIVYDSKKVTFPMLDKKIASLNVTRYNNLGFVFINNYNVDMLFIDNKPFINYNETGIIDNTTTSFIKYLVKKYFVKTIDFLACDLLENSIWKLYFDFINRQNNVKVRASNDRTGNLSSGGDWILESTGENVEKLYFNSNIQFWNYLLDTGSMSQSTYIIASDNSNNAYSCGKNNYGQLGIGSAIDRNVFTNISTNISGKKVLSIVGGEFHCMLMTDEFTNNVYSCGRNNYGQLGIGNNTNQSTFQPVTSVNDKIIYVYAGGNHSLILTNDTSNNLYSCGNNSKGQLGLGSLIDASRNTFTNITTNISGKKIINISAGNEHSLLLTSDTSNNLYSCGNNSNGELGIGNNTNQSSFQLANVGSINTKKIISISAGRYHSLLLTNENLNNLYSCGENDSGQLGLGNTIDQSSFQLAIAGTINGKRTIYISGGGDHSLILTNDSSNNLYSCGENSSGQLGLANNVDYNSFQLSSNTLQNNYYNGISAGYNHSLLTTFDKTNNFYVVGNNSSGQLDLSNNTTNINILKNSIINIYGKKVILNGLMNSDVPNTLSFNSFNYGTNNTTYYPAAQSNNNNIISISNIADPESLFPTLIGTIGEAYSLSPLGTIFSSTVYFKVNSLYLSNVYYQYNINSELLLMGTNSNILPYYSYDGIDVTIYTNVIFAYIVFTAPPSNTGAQFSNLNNLLISATDAPVILPNTRLNCTFFNTPIITADISGWDISGSITMSSMFRDSSFNGEIANWKPKKVTDMSYMFYGANNFNKKLIYNETTQAWDVTSVTNMSYIFNNSSNFNNSQISGGVTEPMYWELNPNVNITNNVNNSALTVANAQALIPDLLVYLNIGIFTTSTGAGSGTSSVILTFFNEDGTVGDTNSTVAGPTDTIFGARYNIAGEIEWNYKISCQTIFASSGPNQGSISTDLNRNVIVTGRWYNNNGPIVFYNSNDISNSSLNLNFGGNPSSTDNSFLAKYNTDGFSQWRTRLCFNTTLSSHIISNTFCDSNGNIYATGRFLGQALFQDSSLNTWIDISSNGLNTSTNLNTILNYPPSNLSSTSNTTTLVGQLYGNGTYNVTFSSQQGGREARNLFDGAGSWRPLTSNNVGAYVQLQLPYPIILNSYQVNTNTGNGAGVPRSFKLEGSNDNFVTSVLLSTVNWGINEGSRIINITPPVNQAFIYFRLTNLQSGYSTSFIQYNYPLIFYELPNQPDGFLLKYNKDGTGVWFSKITSLNYEMGYQTIVDSSNNIYGTGYHDASGTEIYSGVLNLNGSGTLFKTIPSRGTWVSKYGPNGNVLWATDFSGNIFPSTFGYNLNYDVYIGGYYTILSPTFKNADNSTFTTLTDISAGNSYITKYASEGFGSWTARVSDTAVNINTTGICSERQFQDIIYPEQGLKFAIYNGYFESFTDTSSVFSFFTKNYPYATGISSNLTSLGTSTNGKYVAGDYRSICWWGFFRAKKTGIYTFTTRSDDGSYLLINGNVVVNNSGIHAAQDRSGTCSLIAGTYYYIQIFYGNTQGNLEFSARYTEPGGSAISDASGLNTYFVSPSDAIDLYDNWINQPLGSITSIGSAQVVGRYTTIAMNMSRNENYINLLVTGNDPQLNLLNRPVINPFIYKYIHFKYKIVSGTPSIFEIYYGNNNYTFNEDRKVVYNYPTPINNIIGTWQNAVIDMTNVSNWYLDNWSNYRLDPTQSLGSPALNIQIEYFFISDTSSYPMNESSNNIYASGITTGTNTNIYNSSFYYDTSLNYGLSGNINTLFKSYITNNSFEKTYIVKYNLNGQCQWSIFLKSGENVRVSGINVDKTGNIYVFGEFSITLADPFFNITDKNGTICETYTINTFGTHDTFMIAYSEDGLYLWSTRQSSSINNRVISYGPGSAYYGPSIGLS